MYIKVYKKSPNQIDMIGAFGFPNMAENMPFGRVNFGVIIYSTLFHQLLVGIHSTTVI